MIYPLIDIFDGIFLILILMNLVPNLYLNIEINNPEIQHILTDQPIFI